MATAAPRKSAAPRKRATAPKATEAHDVTPASDESMTKVGFVMVQGEDTKTYAKFTPPSDSGCVGNLYVPKGTTEVRVLLIGPAS